MILEIVGAVFLSLGGGSVVVFALSKWLGGVWANRILEDKRAEIAREYELLVRRRNVYTKLALAMRVFIASDESATSEQKASFLAAFDEAALWASEGVANEIHNFVKLQVAHSQTNGRINPKTMQNSFIRLVSEMRKDCGFPDTTYQHLIVNF